MDKLIKIKMKVLNELNLFYDAWSVFLIILHVYAQSKQARLHVISDEFFVCVASNENI